MRSSKIEGTANRCIFHRIWVTPVKEDDAAKDTTLGPVPNAVGNTFGVLIVITIPWVAKEGSRKSGRVEPLAFLSGTPSAEGVVFMPACILHVEPRSDLVDGPGNKLDKPGREAGRSSGGRLVVVKELRAKRSAKISAGLRLGVSYF